MRARFLSLLPLLFLPFFLTACDSDNPGDPVPMDSTMVGTWVIGSERIGGATPEPVEETLDIRDDGTALHYFFAENDEGNLAAQLLHGTWEATDDSVWFDYEDDSELRYRIEALGTSWFVLENSDSEEPVTLEYARWTDQRDNLLVGDWIGVREKVTWHLDEGDSVIYRPLLTNYLLLDDRAEIYTFGRYPQEALWCVYDDLFLLMDISTFIGHATRFRQEGRWLYRELPSRSNDTLSFPVTHELQCVGYTTQVDTRLIGSWQLDSVDPPDVAANQGFHYPGLILQDTGYGVIDPMFESITIEWRVSDDHLLYDRQDTSTLFYYAYAYEVDGNSLLITSYAIDEIDTTRGFPVEAHYSR